MVVVWTAAMALRRIGVPLIMGELVMGVVLGPAVLGWVEPSEVIGSLVEIAIRVYPNPRVFPQRMGVGTFLQGTAR